MAGQVQILKTNLSWEEVVELETLLIGWFGRKDLKLGTLVNMTDGGDGNNGIVMSAESNMKRIFSEEHLKNIAKVGEVRKGKPDYTKRKTILCLRTGIFYFGIEEASEARGISKNMVSEHLTRLKVNRLDLVYV